MEVDYEPAFLEGAVRAALGERPEARLFHRQRERVYGLADPEEREREFVALDAQWYARLELERPLEQALAEQPLVVAGVARCAVGRPRGAREVGGELLVRDPGPGCDVAEGRLLRLLFDPRALLDADRLLPFLRRELQHVADMIDPAFGYEPQLSVPGGPAAQQAARDRYRALWDAVVDGRLVRGGLLPAAVLEERRHDIERAFRPAGADEAARLASFCEHPAPTHAEIAAAVAASLRGRGPSRGACPLCGFPTAELVLDRLDAATIASVCEDFPGWEPADGCCCQCADLYGARELSAREAAALPGIR